MTTTIQNEKVVPAIIDNVIRLKRDSLGPALLSAISSSLTRENPAYHMMKRMMNRNPNKFQNVKLPPAVITSYEDDGNTVYLPRGYKNRLVEIAQQYSTRIEFYDERVSYEPDQSMMLVDTLKLKNYQRRAISKVALKTHGILVAPCGAGKTVMGVALMVLLRQPTLILVHTNDLLTQWRRELAEKSLFSGGIGVWGGGEFMQGQVVVATIQTLVNQQPNDLRKWMEQFGLVILDEAHHCPAATFMQVMNLCPAKYRVGLTATPNRKDGLEFLMTDVIGDIAAEITDTELVNENRSQSCEVREVVTSFFSKKTVDQWTFLLRDVCSDLERNARIVDQIHEDWLAGHTILALSERVPHCREIAGMLERKGMSVGILVGETPKNIREQIVERTKQGLIDVIVATKVADEGLDIPNLSCLHLMTPSSNQAKLQQRVGRIRRPMEGKVSVVVDYQDLRHAGLLRMARDRKSCYRRWGFTQQGGKSL